MNILLCGMMGCGKTTVATALQMELCWLKVDTDTWIEEEYGSIARIFAEHGEAYFRDLETQAAKRVVMLDRCVVAVGGGFVLREENVVPLKKNGKFVYLRARKETLEKRLEGNRSRPMLQGESLSARLESLLSERSVIYESVADCVVDVDEKSPAEIADKIVRILQLNKET